MFHLLIYLTAIPFRLDLIIWTVFVQKQKQETETKA